MNGEATFCCVCHWRGSTDFWKRQNWCSYSYILYNVYQTKTNTASNLKRIKRENKKEKKPNWKLSNPLACRAVDVKTRGSRNWGGTPDAVGVLHVLSPWQTTDGGVWGGRWEQGGQGGSWNWRLGKVEGLNTGGDETAQTSAGQHLFLQFILFSF